VPLAERVSRGGWPKTRKVALAAANSPRLRSRSVRYGCSTRRSARLRLKLGVAKRTPCAAALRRQARAQRGRGRRRVVRSARWALIQHGFQHAEQSLDLCRGVRRNPHGDALEGVRYMARGLAPRSREHDQRRPTVTGIWPTPDELASFEAIFTYTCIGASRVNTSRSRCSKARPTRALRPGTT
jgi:hypothetical protein